MSVDISTYEPEEKCDLSINTMSGCHRFSSEKSSRSWAMLRIGKEKRMTPLKKECTLRTKPFGKIFSYTEVMSSHGRSSVDDWWTTLVQSSPLGVRIAPGPYRPSKESKDGRLRSCFVYSGLKTKRRNMGRPLCKNLQNGQEDVDKDGIALTV